MIWLSLGFAAELSGQVQDAAGLPLSGVEIKAYDLRGNYAQATSRSNGAWALVGLPAGGYRVRAYPPDDPPALPQVERYYGDTWDICASEVITLAEDTQTSGVDMTLPVGGTITGRLLDPDGQPVVGATVVCGGDTDRTMSNGGIALTDAAGVFRVLGLDSDPGVPQPFWCEAYADGFPNQYFSQAYAVDRLTAVGLGASSDLGDWSLLPGIAVTGTLYGPSGPLSSGVVYVYSTSQVRTVSVDSGGHYRADGLPPGDVVAWAQVDGFATTYYPDSDRPGDRVSVHEEGALYEGLDLHLPVENVLSVHLVGEGDLGDVSLLLYNSDYTVGRGDSADETGLVEIGGLFDGDYSLQIYGADAGFMDGPYSDAQGQPEIISLTGDLDIEIPLFKGAALSGQIHDPDGVGIYGAAIVASSEHNTFFAETDETGNYVLSGLPDGNYTLAVSYSALCPVDPDWVEMWWQDARDPALSLYVSVEAGTELEGYDFSLEEDQDHDGMGDRWEAQYGLDTTRDDALEDPDGDGFPNLTEWRLNTDPTGQYTVGHCGCQKGGDSAFLLIPLFLLRRYRGAKV